MSTLKESALEPTTRKFIEGLEAKGGTPLYKLSIEDARKLLEDLQSAYDVEKLPVDIEDITIEGGPSGKISLRIFRPKNSKGTLPVIMYFHGAGWILGSKESYDRLARDLTVGANAALVFVNFTRSPEAKYPTAIEEAYAATKYIAEHGEKHHLDASHLVVAGDSVGGNMTIAVTLLAKERKGPKIDFQVLFYPVTDAGMDTPSYKQFADGPWLTKAAMEWFWNAYEPDVSARKKHTISPLRATTEQLRGLPPALVITDENDVLRDEGEAYAHKLMEAGVDVTSIRFLGTHHDFVLLNAIRNTPAAHEAIELACDKIRMAIKGQACCSKSTCH